ncbi:unnamed protein product [Lota lota]
MEDIYANVDMLKPSTASPNHPGPLRPRAMGTGRSWLRPELLGLGLLCVILLAGLLVLGLLLQGLQSELTERQKELSTLVEERNQQNSSLFSLKQRFDELLKENIKSIPSLPHRKRCPKGWRKFENSCYHKSNSVNSWENSRKDCMERGGDLVVIDSSQEQKFLSEYKTTFWIGLSDLEQEGTWKWVDGAPLILSYWGESQPNNGNNDSQYGEEDCAHLHLFGFIIKWNDISCDAKLQWICEKSAADAQISMAQ